jgi:hypothetical protein
VCASESCGMSHDALPSIHRVVKRALFSLPQQNRPPFRNLKPLPGIAEAILFPLNRKNKSLSGAFDCAPAEALSKDQGFGKTELLRRR